jgi:uncharacterized protein YciI
VSTVPPIRREVLVDAGPEAAFNVFTAGIGRWWPIAGHSVHGAGGTVAFTGGQLVELAATGQQAVWGTVTRWEPPAAVAFTWHPGRTPERPSHVEVTFTAAGPQTLVTLIHSGWDAYADPAAMRAEYDHGWPIVLGQYQAQAGRPGGEASRTGESGQEQESGQEEEGGSGEDGGKQTWVALLHRPGPAAPPDGGVFDDPRFAEHVAFLNRMREAGYLVAAGPMTDAAGEGMTILRLPGTGQLARATMLATEDDVSVAQGFFSVTVRPWQVMMQAWHG